MSDKEKAPDRCYNCKYCEQREQHSYMPYRECTLTGRMIYFGPEDGYDRMKWCPLVKGEEG